MARPTGGRRAKRRLSNPYRKRRPTELAAGTFFLDLGGGGHRDTVFIAGSGRSGTTWLSELINHDNRFRFIFEPFHPGKVGLCEGFLSKQYLTADFGTTVASRFDANRKNSDSRFATRDSPERSDPHLDTAGKILSGRARSRWADRFNRKFIARRRLVKDIRANLLLGWMKLHFPEMPMVLILRHPCAVADSRLRLGWRDNLDEVMSQEKLVEDYLKPFEADILAAKDPFERSVFLWCIENYVPLRQLGDGGIHIVFYERLLSDPEGELAPLFAFLGEEFDATLPRSIAEESGAGRNSRRISGWTERVSEIRRRRAAEILELFGMDRIYGEDPMPRPEGITEVSGRRG